MTVDGLGELQQKRDKAKASHLTRNVPPPLNPRKKKPEHSTTSAGVAGDASSRDGVSEILSKQKVEDSEINLEIEMRNETPFRVEKESGNRPSWSPKQHGHVETPRGEATQQVTIYVLPDTKRQAAKVAKRTKRTNATIALDALDSMRDQLHELIEERQSRRRPAESMFATRRALGAREPSYSPPRDAFIIRVLESDYEVLEGLSNEHGAKGISELVSVALEAIYGRGRGS